MSFVSALAVFDTASKYAKQQSLSLKWPNDLLLNGAKLSGILLETVQHNGRFGLIIGIGVNLVHGPVEDLLEARSLPGATLVECSEDEIAPEEFLIGLANAMEHWQSRWMSEGFVPIREAWLSRATGLGSQITARLPDREYEGVFEDVDEVGSLVLRTKSSVVVLPAADVYFRDTT